MAEVTRVPIQPIAKGSVVKLWLGVIIAALIGAGIAWAAVPQGLELDTLVAGEGPNPGPEDVVFVNYVGKVAGTDEVFDQSQEVPLPIPGIFPDGTPLPLDAMLPGFRDGAVKMQKGGKYELFIPADQAYGAAPPPGSGIPADADLLFEVELLDFMDRADFERRLGILRQAMESAMPPGGAPDPGGAPVPPPGPAQ